MKLLISEPPLQVLPSLAVEIGLNGAIILQQLHYWIDNPKVPGKIVDGEKWIFNDYEEWKTNFPFWSERTIQRIFLSLENSEFVLSAQFDGYDRRKSYRPNYEKIEEFETSNVPKWHDGRRQSGAFEDANVARTLIESETTQRLRKEKPAAQAPEPVYTNIEDDFPVRSRAPKRKESFTTPKKTSKTDDKVPDGYTKQYDDLGKVFESIIGRPPLSKSEWVFWIYGNAKSRAKGLKHFAASKISGEAMLAAVPKLKDVTISSPNTLFNTAFQIQKKITGSGNVTSNEDLKKIQESARAERKHNKRIRIENGKVVSV